MKVIFVKNNDNIKYLEKNTDGYKFIPRKKNIGTLIVVDNNMISYIINKKLSKNLNKIDKTIKLIINSDATLVSDCDMMISELNKIICLIKDKYISYIDEFEFFSYIKNIYVLNKVIDLKRKVLIIDE